MCIYIFIIIIFLEVWDTLIGFTLILIKTFVLVYECVGVRAKFWNELNV